MKILIKYKLQTKSLMSRLINRNKVNFIKMKINQLDLSIHKFRKLKEHLSKVYLKIIILKLQIDNLILVLIQKKTLSLLTSNASIQNSFKRMSTKLLNKLKTFLIIINCKLFYLNFGILENILNLIINYRNVKTNH